MTADPERVTLQQCVEFLISARVTQSKSLCSSKACRLLLQSIDSKCIFLYSSFSSPLTECEIIEKKLIFSHGLNSKLSASCWHYSGIGIHGKEFRIVLEWRKYYSVHSAPDSSPTFESPNHSRLSREETQPHLELHVFERQATVVLA